ncbi:MAG: aldo/keto reductase [Halanaeroarchaeum sp.]
MTVPTLTLPDGDEMPVVGIGTWDLDEKAVKRSVEVALEGEYTHVDMAEGYRNEADIGEVLTKFDRDELFLTTKVLPSNLDYESVIESCEQTLNRLNTDYLDLYLIHWPNPAISLRETLDALEHLYHEGAIRNVGVSNFSAYQLSNALHISNVPIAVNQIEYHPYYQRPELLEYARESNVVVEAAAPLARTEVLDDETLVEIAEKYDKSPAQIVLRWAIEKDLVVIPKSSSPEHIADNIDVLDWRLEAADHERIDGLDRNQPVYDTPAKDWSDDIWGIAP